MRSSPWGFSALTAFCLVSYFHIVMLYRRITLPSRRPAKTLVNQTARAKISLPLSFRAASYSGGAFTASPWRAGRVQSRAGRATWALGAFRPAPRSRARWRWGSVALDLAPPLTHVLSGMTSSIILYSIRGILHLGVPRLGAPAFPGPTPQWCDPLCSPLYPWHRQIEAASPHAGPRRSAHKPGAEAVTEGPGTQSAQGFRVFRPKIPQSAQDFRDLGF